MVDILQVEYQRMTIGASDLESDCALPDDLNVVAVGGTRDGRMGFV
jgi:hypothetical protein